MLCNSALIMALAKPTIASRVRGPWVEWAAFREPVYLLFNVGIFFVLLGVYIAYFYVSTELQCDLQCSSKLLTLRRWIDNNVRKGCHSHSFLEVASQSHGAERCRSTRENDTSSNSGRVVWCLQCPRTVCICIWYHAVLLGGSLKRRRLHGLRDHLRYMRKCGTDTLPIVFSRINVGFDKDGHQSGHVIHDS